MKCLCILICPSTWGTTHFNSQSNTLYTIAYIFRYKTFIYKYYCKVLTHFKWILNTHVHKRYTISMSLTERKFCKYQLFWLLSIIASNKVNFFYSCTISTVFFIILNLLYFLMNANCPWCVLPLQVCPPQWIALFFFLLCLLISSLLFFPQGWHSP